MSAITLVGKHINFAGLASFHAHIRSRQVTDTLWEMRFATDDHHMFSDVFTSELPAERRFTDLHLAVLKYGYMDLDKAIERLTSSTLSIDTVDSNGRTALSWATHRGDIEIVDRLLRHGADSGIGDKYGVVPLQLAAHNVTTGCMETLLSFGANVDQTDIHGRTAAHYACEYQNPLNGQAVQMLRMLQNHGADILRADNYSRTGLHKSAAVGNASSLTFLLREGCDKDKLDDWGKSALVDAIKRNQHSALEALLHFGSPDNNANLGLGHDSSLLHLLAIDADLRSLRIVYKHRLLGLNVNLVDAQGRTAQDIFDTRPLPLDDNLMEVWYMLLTQLEGDEFTDGTGSEKSWLFDEALEDQFDPLADAKKVYGLE
ncbi:hypothetical protein IG631_04886 [Alternaria alternata]|nr:hypothetical protein IG631_04886 [Alternaria alternata]